LNRFYDNNNENDDKSNYYNSTTYDHTFDSLANKQSQKHFIFEDEKKQNFIDNGCKINNERNNFTRDDNFHHEFSNSMSSYNDNNIFDSQFHEYDSSIFKCDEIISNYSNSNDPTNVIISNKLHDSFQKSSRKSLLENNSFLTNTYESPVRRDDTSYLTQISVPQHQTKHTSTKIHTPQNWKMSSLMNDDSSQCVYGIPIIDDNKNEKIGHRWEKK